MQNFKVRRAGDRGYANRDWLESYHSFSFANYYDPEYMQFSVLRVINDDIIAPDRGFGMHPHRDMEIITYMLRGELQHRDSIGYSSVIKAGDVQRMTAGTGIAHSEMNASNAEPTHLLQIWVLPERLGLQPSYEEKHFSSAQKLNQWCLIVDSDGRDGALKINQDIQLYAAILNPKQGLSYKFGDKRSVYLHVAQGDVVVSGQALVAGDALMINGAAEIEVKAHIQAELLLFDLPGHTLVTSHDA